MGAFVKLYGSILDSTIWLEALPTKVVWITMLAMADANGCVMASLPNLARRAGVSREECTEAIKVLSAPDPDSKTTDHEGRRIEKVDGGWAILNHRKYRDMRTDTQIATAERVRRHRERQRQGVTVTNVTKRNVRKRPVRIEAEAEEDTEAETTRSKTTTSVSGDPALNGASPEKPSVPWVTEGVAWWKGNVGMVKHGHFGAALSEPVREYTWPQVFDALKCYVQENKARGKTVKINWFADEIIQWIEWARMPATDERGNLTPRAKAINRELGL